MITPKYARELGTPTITKTLFLIGEKIDPDNLRTFLSAYPEKLVESGKVTKLEGLLSVEDALKKINYERVLKTTGLTPVLTRRHSISSSHNINIKIL